MAPPLIGRILRPASLPANRTPLGPLLCVLLATAAAAFPSSQAAFASASNRRASSVASAGMGRRPLPSSSAADAAASKSEAGGGPSAPSSPLPTTWDGLDARASALRRIVPPLASNLHKGTGGRIAVLGGSARYAGAPYYAALSALRAGCDLATVYCAAEAAVPIKSYSPELMVDPVYSAKAFDGLVEEEARLVEEEAMGRPEASSELAGIRAEQDRLVSRMVSSVAPALDRLHCLVVGPGLGRCPLVMRAAAAIVSEARSRGLPLVLDADGLHMLTLAEHRDLVAGYQGCVLTPNAMEARKLEQALGGGAEDGNTDRDGNGGAAGEGRRSSFERATEGVVVVRKGAEDEISWWCEQPEVGQPASARRSAMRCEEPGGLKRSGGIGDILAGCIGAFSAWHLILSKPKSLPADDLVLGCWAACCITKRATRSAFEDKRRGMTAPDVLERLVRTVDEMTAESIRLDDDRAGE